MTLREHINQLSNREFAEMIVDIDSEELLYKNEIIEISAFPDTFYDFRAVFGRSFNIRLFL